MISVQATLVWFAAHLYVSMLLQKLKVFIKRDAVEISPTEKSARNQALGSKKKASEVFVCYQE